jgi:serine protease Do
MNRSVLRIPLCCALFSLATVAGAQVQSSPTMSSLPDFTGIVQKNAASVVHVEAKYTGEKRAAGRSRQGKAMPGQGMPDNDPQAEMFRRFFGMPMMPSPEEQKHTSVGSGFILSGDGYILTNNHVVAGADKVTVRFQDHRTLTAKVVGTDPTYDIAVLKVDAGSSLPAVSIGDSHSLKPGQWVLAIGSPFGFDYTVTQGIVSAVGRNLGEQDQRYTSFIQTDVPINRGNSGGPLFNLQGQVVGINSQIYSNTGDYTGVSFSIPIDVAMNAVQQIKRGGYVTRGQLGVMVGALTDDIVKGLKLDSNNGAIVSDVSAGSGAEKAGLRQGDIILSFNGQAISQSADLPPLVGMTKPGSKAAVEILRNGKKQTVQVTVGAAPRDGKAQLDHPEAPPARTSQSALGMSVQEPDADARQQMGLKAGEGVEIGEITGPAAASAGLQQGDVILMVGQQKIGSVAAFRAATQGIKPGDTVLLLVRRGDQSSFIGLTLPADK